MHSSVESPLSQLSKSAVEADDGRTGSGGKKVTPPLELLVTSLEYGVFNALDLHFKTS